jgi:hypothetical protein
MRRDSHAHGHGDRTKQMNKLAAAERRTRPNRAESLAARNKSRVAATLPSKLRPRQRIHERNKNALATGRMHDHQSRGTDPRPSTAAEGLNQPTKMEQWQLKLIKQRERIQR